MPINHLRDDETTEQTVKTATIRRLICYLIPFKKEILITLFLMGLVLGIELLNPYFLKVAIDNYIAQKNFSGLLLLGSGMLLLKLIALYATRQRIKAMAQVTNQILLNIRQELYTHIQKLSFSFFDTRPIGKILARIIGDVNSLSDLFSNSVTSLIPDLAMVTAVIIIMFSMNFRLALAALVTLPFLILVLGSIQIFSHKRWQSYRKKVSTTNAFTHENFSGIRVVQSFTAEKMTCENFGTLLRKNMRAYLKAVYLTDFFWPTVEMSWGLATITVCWYGVQLLNTGTVTVGLLVAFIGYVSMFWHPIMNISNFYNNLITNLSGAERIFEILDLAPTIIDESTALTLPPIQGEIHFEQVTFAYDADEAVLKELNFTIKPGETIALVGPTGAGKTSIVNLISRFYEPQAGQILIDGYDLKEVTMESLRSQMAFVLQDTFLFSGTIKENLRYGKLDATNEEIVAAAKLVHAHDFIMKLPHGYETNLNERGSRLSFGERQQLAFARALLANPRILILDEATAGIDTHTERLVQQGIKELLKGRTSIVIAHRLSTIRDADRILVIDDGQILESGTHSELLLRQGLYYQLVNAQYHC